MERDNDQGSNASRRRFLRQVPLMLVGAVVINTVGRAFLYGLTDDKSKPPDFPKGSIFKADRDRYL